MKVFILIFLIFNNSISPSFARGVQSSCLKSKRQVIKFAKHQFILAYGSEVLEIRSFRAKLVDNKVWIVRGIRSNDSLGGVPYIEIQKENCKILNLYHTK
jgi:hypothetical protein